MDLGVGVLICRGRLWRINPHIFFKEKCSNMLMFRHHWNRRDIIFFRTSEMVYVNVSEFSSPQTHSQPSPNKRTIPTSGAERVIWTEADCHGMTNDGWLQFNYTLRVSLFCGWLAINEAFQYRTQSVEFWQYIFVIFQTQILCVCERTLTISLSPLLLFYAHIYCFIRRL